MNAHGLKAQCAYSLNPVGVSGSNIRQIAGVSGSKISTIINAGGSKRSPIDAVSRSKKIPTAAVSGSKRKANAIVSGRKKITLLVFSVYLPDHKLQHCCSAFLIVATTTISSLSIS